MLSEQITSQTKILERQVNSKNHIKKKNYKLVYRDLQKIIQERRIGNMNCKSDLFSYLRCGTCQ